MPSLTIEQFNSLSTDEKANVVYNLGVHLLDYKNISTLFSLYQLSNFYVEMVYNLKRRQALTRIKIHATPNSIDKFLTEINIEELSVGQ